MNKKIVITGASGFVGRNMKPYLEQNGYILYPLNLRQPLSGQEFDSADAVIHLAGKAHDHAGTAEAAAYFEVNTELTRTVFKQFLQSEASVFIHFSTVAAITDEHIDGVLTEEAEPRPSTPYGQSKLKAEQLLQEAILPVGKKIFIIRPAMIHGPGDKGNLTLLYNIVAKGIPYPLAAYENQRSFLSIDNLNYAVEKLLTQAGSIPSGIYNLVDDMPVSTNEVVRLIAKATEKKEKLWVLPKLLARSIARLGDFLPLPINSKRLAKLTGNYIVANDKIKKALNIESFPVTAQEGLIKTIKSFASK